MTLRTIFSEPTICHPPGKLETSNHSFNSVPSSFPGLVPIKAQLAPQYELSAYSKTSWGARDTFHLVERETAGQVGLVIL